MPVLQERVALGVSLFRARLASMQKQHDLTDSPALLQRRQVLGGLALGSLALSLGGCATGTVHLAPEMMPGPLPGSLEAQYGAFTDNGFEVEALDLTEIDPDVLRQAVRDPTGERPGTIVVATGERRLYFVEPGGRATRYGIGVGREGATWRGRARVGRKAVWPRWRPTDRMIARDPKNAEWAGGMAGGIENPLGARALYLYDGSRDTHYRLHGTNDPSSIGQAVSSGCIRLFNHDIIDLFERAPEGTPVLVRA